SQLDCWIIIQRYDSLYIQFINAETVNLLCFGKNFSMIFLFLLIVSIIFPAVIVIIVEFAVFAAPTVILLQIICERRA
ncbi:hypothetical protein QQF64_026056, partial [Cirrhinus molitorella]